MTDGGGDPWWASGPDGPAQDDPLDAHRRARAGDAGSAAGGAAGPANGQEWLADAAEMVARFASEAGRRLSARMAPAGATETAADEPASEVPLVGPHADGVVCDACPICIGLRAVQQVRPDVIAHLSDAAYHFSLALRAVADAQAGDTDVGFTSIDLDP